MSNPAPAGAVRRAGLLFLLALTARAQNPTAADLLARGTRLLAAQPAEAVKLLEQALRLDSSLDGLQHELGLAYHAIGDEADAAAELREAVSRDPDSAVAHNDLGVVLFQTGDAKAALEEFRAAARLAPRDANAHFNVAEALARTGQSASAVAELRVASGLAPADAGLARLVKQSETALAAPADTTAPANTIKVEVRQVLVPVVVTDAQGHHVTGLKQADFKVLEDGVEQKITAFSVENSGTPEEGPPGAAPALTAASSAAPQAARGKPRRTYLVLIDTLHTSFHHLASAREALVRLFRQEQSADSQYILVALGAEPQILVNVTPDPAAVLAVLDSNKKMEKMLLDAQTGGLAEEMDRFRASLTETRYACDLSATDNVYKVKCQAGITRAMTQSQQIAELDRTLAVTFLRQFRSLVTQLARARDRRTIILISDGFQVEPGREVLSLVNAFFPPASHCLVPPDVFCPPNQMPSPVRLAGEFEPILKLAAAGNVTIDTIDARGVYGPGAFDSGKSGTPVSVDGAVDRAEQDIASGAGNTLMEIAAATGGTAFRDDNNLLQGMERAFADGRDYYTLAYVSSNRNDDGNFRAITVQVPGRKVAVQAKRGYWAAPAVQ